MGGLRAVGGVNYFDLKNSDIFVAEGDYQANSAEYGIKYVASNNSSMTLLGRRTHGEYDKRVINTFSLNDSGFDQSDAELRFVWAASGKSTLNGRLGYLDRGHDNYSVRDYSGPVGSLDYIWDVSRQTADQCRVSAGSRLLSDLGVQLLPGAGLQHRPGLAGDG